MHYFLRFSFVLTILLFFILVPGFSQPANYAAQQSIKELKRDVDDMAADMEKKVIDWRHHLHQYPELSNREFKTAAFIEDHLRSLGLDIRSHVAHTGIVAVLRGGKPGPVVALRADMDALPIKEQVDLPYASKVQEEYNGEMVDVMHACGHDTHVAMLMGAANILTALKDSLPGTVVFLFQPAEEGAPPGERGGAEVMIEEGALENPKVDAIFGLHIGAGIETGKLVYKPGVALAAVNTFTMVVHGKGTHGSTPWTGIDPIVTAAEIIMGLQTIVSREMDLTRAPAVITIGKISGGVRPNIIPDEVTMVGTIRTLDTSMQRIILQRIRTTATNIAESAGATVDIDIDKGYPITYNDPALTQEMVPTLNEVAGGPQNVQLSRASTGAEDFSFYEMYVPGLFVFLGGMKPGTPPAQAPLHHTSQFSVEDSSMRLGVRTLCYLTLDYMVQAGQ
jgi:amidohydrolase